MPRGNPKGVGAPKKYGGSPAITKSYSGPAIMHAELRPWVKLWKLKNKTPNKGEVPKLIKPSKNVPQEHSESEFYDD